MSDILLQLQYTSFVVWTQVLVNLHDANKQDTAISSSEQEKCNIHHEKMSVYCETCKTSICHECALWSQEHKEHNFKPLDMIFKRNTQILQEEVSINLTSCHHDDS